MATPVKDTGMVFANKIEAIKALRMVATVTIKATVVNRNGVEVATIGTDAGYPSHSYCMVGLKDAKDVIEAAIELGKSESKDNLSYQEFDMVNRYRNMMNGMLSNGDRRTAYISLIKYLTDRCDEQDI